MTDTPIPGDRAAHPEPPAEAARLADELVGYALDTLGGHPEALAAADIATKEHAADPVTDLDRSVEQHVRRRIAEVFPDHRVRGEEYDDTGPARARCVWWVDPIDGTTNFAHGIGWHSFSLALTVDDEPVLGVVADPSRREVYRAVGDTPATVGRRPARVSPATELAGTVVLTEWLAHTPWDGMPELLAGLAGAYCTARVMGSSALSIAQVAAGRAAAAVIGRFNAVDDLAAAFIAVRAGATVLSTDGTLHPTTGGIAVVAPGVTEALAALLPAEWAHRAQPH